MPAPFPLSDKGLRPIPVSDSARMRMELCAVAYGSLRPAGAPAHGILRGRVCNSASIGREGCEVRGQGGVSNSA